MDACSTLQNTHSRRPLLICYSHLRWNFVYQRPQHLLSRAMRYYDVAYFEEPLRESVGAPLLRRETSAEGIVVLTPILPDAYDDEQSIRAQHDLLNSFIESANPASLVFWYYTPTALAFSSEMSRDVTVYDCMDELSAFKMAHPRMGAYEGEMFDQADVVFTGGRSLYEAKKLHHLNIHLFPSSIDANHFGKARLAPRCPADIAQLSNPQLGYFGVIDERMDLGLVATMADARPDWNFVMIGPVVKIDPASLPKLPNIHWIGAREYSALPDYIASWDVGLMPFALNESTRFISPTKTPEYLSAGCPVVSTAIADVVNPYGALGLVEIASTAEEAIACVEHLMQRDPMPWLNAVDAYLDGNSWDHTWAQMNAHISALLKPTRYEVSAGKMIGA